MDDASRYVLTDSAVDAAVELANRLPWAPKVSGEAAEQRDIELRQGLMTQREVAGILGTSYQNIQQIERKALRKARAWCLARGLSLYDLLP
jgi:DNA-binding XRE family transcriptional regulator